MCAKIIDKKERKNEIAFLAMEIFAQHGFKATTTSQIAKHAGISKGSIYLYFKSKEELIVYAANLWVETVARKIDLSKGKNNDPFSRLKALFDESTSAFLENPQIISLFLEFIQATIRDNKHLKELDIVKKISAPIRKAIIDILKDGVSRGRLRPEIDQKAEQIAINLVAFVDGLGMHYVANPGMFDLQEQIALHIELLVDSLRISRY